jgi:Cdc6-like AAA superfamily ATPase
VWARQQRYANFVDLLGELAYILSQLGDALGVNGMISKAADTRLTDEEVRQMIVMAGRAFSPATPIDSPSLFAGRIKEIELVSGAINTRGQHAVIFGERGIGKTSLANILKESLIPTLTAGERIEIVRVNCAANDTFETVWRRVFQELPLDGPSGFSPQPIKKTHTLADLIGEQYEPGEIRRLLQQYSKTAESVIIIDEFDRLEDSRDQTLFADTIKDLSDNAVNSTIVLVGVANTVDELIAKHASIDRPLVQVRMPRMNTAELEETVRKALEKWLMFIHPDALRFIVLLSQGLPHYTHLLGQESGLNAVRGRRRFIERSDVEAGIGTAIEKCNQSIGTAYHQATASQKKYTLYKPVLLACALAKVDDAGMFASTDVRDVLRKITGRDYDIPNFSQHLDQFCSDHRRTILEKVGTARRFRFRFKNPLLQPYIIMRGVKDGIVKDSLFNSIERTEVGNPAAEQLF